MIRLWTSCLSLAGCLSVAQSARPPEQPAPSAIRAHYQRAQEALASKRYPEAAREFQELLRIDPKSAEAHANLGTVYYAQAKYLEATGSFEKALKIRPGLKGAGAFLGMSLARAGRIQEAIPLLEKGFRSPLSDEWKLEAGLLLGDAYQRVNDLSRLQQVIAEIERLYPTNAEVLYLSYRMHATLGARAVAGLVKSAPDSARLQQLAGELLESEGDFATAVTQYRKALEIEPRLPGCHRALGVALMNTSTDDATRREAEDHFRQEIGNNPNDAAAEYQLGEMFWLRNQAKDALSHFTRALQLQPSFPDALIAAGKAQIALGQPAQAITLLEKAVALDPANDVARYRLAKAYQGSGNRQAADREFAEFRRLRTSLESLRTLYRQIQETRITAQRVE